MYALATYAYARRDFWTDREHRDYWRAHLHMWPARKGRSGDRESLAFAIANAETLGMTVEEFVSAIGYTKDDLRDRNVLDLAARMQVEIDAGPSDVRVPIVVTDEELDRMPLLTAHQTLDVYQGAANVKVGALAREVVMRGAAAAGAWRRKADEPRGINRALVLPREGLEECTGLSYCAACATRDQERAWAGVRLIGLSPISSRCLLLSGGSGT